MIKTIKIFELVILGFLFPLTVVYLKLSQSILLFLWIICIYAIIIMTLFYRSEIKFNRLLKISYSKNKKYINIILIRWILLSLVLFLFTKFFFPEKLFLIQKKDSDLLYKIFILYPFFFSTSSRIYFLYIFFC